MIKALLFLRLPYWYSVLSFLVLQELLQVTLLFYISLVKKTKAGEQLSGTMFLLTSMVTNGSDKILFSPRCITVCGGQSEIGLNLVVLWSDQCPASISFTRNQSCQDLLGSKNLYRRWIEYFELYLLCDLVAAQCIVLAVSRTQGYCISMKIYNCSKFFFRQK